LFKHSMKTVVINLSSRPDRMELFGRHWDWLEYERIDGVVSDIPHTGCGLAHVNAIRQGLCDHEWCLILEDDARLSCSRDVFLHRIEEATASIEWDAVFLGANSHKIFPEPEKIERVSGSFFMCSKTKSIRSCTAMLWSRRALPLIAEFERILREGHVFPIDRMLISFTYPWVCTRTTGDEAEHTTEITPVPVVWVCKDGLVIQEVGLLSDNELELRECLADSYLEHLFTRD
jgi:GR25 family glycosyltransferase involved in LPS biosynthesis